MKKPPLNIVISREPVQIPAFQSSTLPFPRETRKNLTTIHEIPGTSQKIRASSRERAEKTEKFLQKPSNSALLRVKELFQFKKPRTIAEKTEHVNENSRRLREIATIMKGNHEIYFKKREKTRFFSEKYENLYRKHRALVKQSYFLDVVELNSLEKVRLFGDSWPCLDFRRDLLVKKAQLQMFCRRIAENRWFRGGVLLLIWLNSLFCAAKKLDLLENSQGNSANFQANVVLCVFFAEMLVKIAGLGADFLRSWLNLVDCLIVCAAFAVNFLDFPAQNFQAIEAKSLISALIVLRPLTTLANIASFQLIAAAISSATALLKESLMIFLFFQLIFTVTGLTLFSGFLKNRCFSRETGLLPHNSAAKLCENDSFCDFPLICGKMLDNPNWDFTSFDSFFSAFLVVFQISTLGAWNNIMIFVQESFSVFSAIYFVVIVVICALFLVNLSLAVLKVKFSEFKERWGDRLGETFCKQKRYSFEKLRKMQIFIGKQGKKQLLMQKSKSVFGKLKEISRFNPKKNSVFPGDPGNLAGNPKKSRVFPEKPEESAEKTEKVKQFALKLQKTREFPSEPEKLPKNLCIPPEKPENSLNSLAKLEKSAADRGKAAKSLRFLPIKLKSSKPIALNSEEPLLITDPEALLSEFQECQRFNCLENRDFLAQDEDPASPNLKEMRRKPKNVEKIRESRDFSLKFQEIEQDLAGKEGKSQESPRSCGKIKKFSGDSLFFPRISHGFSFVKEKKQLLRENEMISRENQQTPRENQKNAKKTEEFGFDVDYEDPELAILKSLDPKYLKLQPNHAKSFEATSSADVLLPKAEKPLRNRDFPEGKRTYEDETGNSPVDFSQNSHEILGSSWGLQTKSRESRESAGNPPKSPGNSRKSQRFPNNLPKIEYLPSFSKRFYRESVTKKWRLLDKSPNKNLTRLLLAGQTLKKLNKVKLPLAISLETELLRDKLRENLDFPAESPQNQDFYFFRVQNFIKKQQVLAKHATKARISRKTRRETALNSFSSVNFKDFELEELKKRCFGESALINLAENQGNGESSSSDEEIEARKALETARDGTLLGVLRNLPAKTQKSASSSRRSGETAGNSQKLAIFERETRELERFLGKTRENAQETPEISARKREKIKQKAKNLQEFNNIERFVELTPSSSRESPWKPRFFWSAEDVLGYTLEFYRYSSDSLHILKRLRRILKRINYSPRDFDIWEAGLRGKFSGFRKKVRFFVENERFSQVILALVLANTVVLSVNGTVDDNSSASARLATVNSVFTAIFAAEVGLKLLALGVSAYFRDKFNIFDCLIVASSLVELVFLENTQSAISAFRALSFFKAVRVLRVSRLLRGFNYAGVLAGKIADSLQNCLKITLILLIFLYSYSLLGMNVYEESFDFKEIPQNFRSFPNALVIVLQLTTLSNWNFILFSCLRTQVSKLFSVFFITSAVIIGNYVLLTLLLAILLDVFANNNEESKENRESPVENAENSDFGEDLEDETEKKILKKIELQLENGNSQGKAEENVANAGNFKKFMRKFTAKLRADKEKDGKSAKSRKKSLENQEIPEETEENVANDAENGSFSSNFPQIHENSFRNQCFRALKSAACVFVCKLAIFLSLVQLIIYTYVYDKDKRHEISLQSTSFSLEILINLVFSLELLAKVFSLGFLRYWAKGWNRVDLTVTFLSVFVSFFEYFRESSTFLPYFRVFRVFAVLRVLTYSESYRAMINSLWQSLKAIASLVLMILLIWLMFSIIGVSFLEGKLGYCDIPDYYHVSRDECAFLNEEWKVRPRNFDNVLNGMLVLLIMSFFEGFPVFIYDFMDAAGPETGPIKDNSQYILAFFLLFIVVSAIFLMNLFICVIFMNYILAEKREKTRFLTEEQLRWISIQRLLVKETPDFSYLKQPDTRFRRFLYALTRSQVFEKFVFGCIVVNTITMAMYYEGCPEDYEQNLQRISLAISVVFVLEAAIKLGALGFGGYFYCGWNKLDFFVVCTSVFDVVIGFLDGNQAVGFGGTIGKSLRILKVARLLRLIKSNAGLQKLVLTSVYSLPYLVNAFGFLSLVYFMFTVLAVFLFRNITEGVMIDDQWVNFASFFTALLNLLRLTAGEDWSDLMYDTMNESRTCVAGKSCGNSLNFMFFVGFLIVIRLILLNIFILVVVQQFEENYICSDNPLQHYNKDINTFKEKWVASTVKQNGLRLNQADIIRFFLHLPPPLGFDFFSRNPHLLKYSREIKEKILLKLKKNAAISIMNMNLFSDDKGYLYFNEVLFACMKRAYYEDLYENSSNLGITLLKLEEEKNLKKISRMKQKLISHEKTDHNSEKEEKKPINPLLGIITATICFKTWVKFQALTKERLKEASFSLSEGEESQDFKENLSSSEEI